jgi:hypothetical protein
MQEFRPGVLEIEVENDQRPPRPVTFPQGFFDDRPHRLEEIITQTGLAARGLVVMCDGDSAFACRRIDLPCQILLDGDRIARLQRPLETIRPLPLIAVAQAARCSGTRTRCSVPQVEAGVGSAVRLLASLPSTLAQQGKGNMTIPLPVLVPQIG